MTKYRKVAEADLASRPCEPLYPLPTLYELSHLIEDENGSVDTTADGVPTHLRLRLSMKTLGALKSSLRAILRIPRVQNIQIWLPEEEYDLLVHGTPLPDATRTAHIVLGRSGLFHIEVTLPWDRYICTCFTARPIDIRQLQREMRAVVNAVAGGAQA